MHRPTARSALALAATSIVALALACSDATAPSGPKHPIVGVYDVTTSLESYTYFVSGTPTTFNTVPAGPARLTGTLTIDDSIIATPGLVQLPLTKASMQETLCSTGNPPCTSAGLERTVDYTLAYQAMTVSGDSIGVSGILESSYESLRFKTGTFGGDSIVGTLEWMTKLGPASETYSGTYVARRRR